jgi:hypothetical protein
VLPAAAEEIAGRRAVQLRLDRPRNNQAKHIRWAQEHELDPRLLHAAARASRAGSYTSLPDAGL